MGKKAKKRQVATLIYRRDAAGEPSFLLATSRETRRCVIPKGWPIKGLKSHETAALEVAEETGVRGPITNKPIGEYRYWKRLDRHFAFVVVDVFLMAFRSQEAEFREAGQRAIGWFRAEEAATLIDEPSLGSLIERTARRLRKKMLRKLEDI